MPAPRFDSRARNSSMCQTTPSRIYADAVWHPVYPVYHQGFGCFCFCFPSSPSLQKHTTIKTLFDADSASQLLLFAAVYNRVQITSEDARRPLDRERHPRQLGNSFASKAALTAAAHFVEEPVCPLTCHPARTRERLPHGTASDCLWSVFVTDQTKNPRRIPTQPASLCKRQIAWIPAGQEKQVTHEGLGHVPRGNLARFGRDCSLHLSFHILSTAKQATCSPPPQYSPQSRSMIATFCWLVITSFTDIF